MSDDNFVLVTGAGGFIGGALCESLAAGARRVRRAVRVARPGEQETIAVGDISPATDWRVALEGARCVVHLAARTHVLRESSADPLAEYRRANVAATVRLAEQARAAGVRRFVLMSSIKVNGESTERPFTESDAPRPEDAYGISKWEAEQALARVAGGAMEVVVLRPPLVYGPRVAGNFRRLLDAVARGTPLPLASIDNRRSLVYVGNLAGAVIAALDAPQAAGKTWLVSDGEDVSTPDLVRAIARALGARAQLLPCPVVALKLAAALTGNRAAVARLTGSLQVDSSAIRHGLGWRPGIGLAEGLAATARWYHSRADA